MVVAMLKILAARTHLTVHVSSVLRGVADFKSKKADFNSKKREKAADIAIETCPVFLQGGGGSH